MALNNTSHLTQWAAQFAVASELCKRGYEVAFTSGHNTPIADLMVVSPREKQQFLVDVKGQNKRNSWIISRKNIRKNLFYILAYVPTAKPNQYSVMSQQQVHTEIKSRLQSRNLPNDYKMTGFKWGTAWKYKESWKSLPK